MSDSETSAGGLNVKRLLPIAVLVAGLVAFFAFDLDEFVTLDALKTHRTVLQGWVESQGPVAWLVYAAIYMAAVAFSIPGGSILTIAGGFMFGPYVATAVVVIGATLGATVLFLAARYAFADYLRGKAGGAMCRMEAGFNENPVSYMLILRLVPLFPFWLVNLVPAFLGVKIRVYVLSTLFGIVPGTFVYALVGDGAGAVLDAGGDLDLGIIFEPRILAPIAGLALLACIPIVYKRFRSRRGAQS
ncbi:MAG: TVP38/TMEM64 family protein [Defluviicoccus sp.]|nr:TVP38/TMEM64 family protein [Defluviicoccus sp.]MDE0386485.1 TVP38/TMEM64 family protein [Defluviicoccus sp.]